MRSSNCELQKLAADYGVDDENRFDGATTEPIPVDDSAYHLVRDNSKCILCRRCVAACAKLQEVRRHRRHRARLRHPHRLRL